MLRRTMMPTITASVLLVVAVLLLNAGLVANAAAPPPASGCEVGFCSAVACCPGVPCSSDGSGGFCIPCGVPCNGGGSPGTSDSPTVSPTRSPSKSPSTAPTQQLRSPTQSPTQSPIATSYEIEDGFLLLESAENCNLNGIPKCCQDTYSVVTSKSNVGSDTSTLRYHSMTLTSTSIPCTGCPVITALSFVEVLGLPSADLSDGRSAGSIAASENDLLRFSAGNCSQTYIVTSGVVLGRYPPSECLSGDGLVQTSTADASTMRVEELRIGTMVEVASGAFEPIIYFSRHWNQRGERSDSDAKAEFLEIFTEGNDKPILLSKGHMIPVIEQNGDVEKTVPAHQVKVGDFVFNADHNAMRVEKLGRVVRQGAFSPVTPSCAMVVDNVLVSCLVESPYHSLVLGLIQVLNLLYKALPLALYSALVERIDYAVGLGYLESGPVSLLATYSRQMIQIVST